MCNAENGVGKPASAQISLQVLCKLKMMIVMTMVMNESGYGEYEWLIHSLSNSVNSDKYLSMYTCIEYDNNDYNRNDNKFKCTVNRTFDRANPDYGNTRCQIFLRVHRTLFWSNQHY